jgi:putative membrane-bound dehydrogenase-like protein
MFRFQIQTRLIKAIEAAKPLALAIVVAVGTGGHVMFAAQAQQETNDFPMSPTEAVRHLSLPSGFSVSIVAAEPEVRQPIAMAFDDRGRLWVAECYTYADLKTNYDMHLRDRIVIFEDSKGTGRFDKRKVFWDQGQRLTSIAPGFGGVFALCAPNLIFIPDRNGDDVPDGPPEVLLDGWDADVVRHNIVNGLKWGPDGWLYGRHGILATSAVGKPGTPESERTRLNAAIWRYHPTRKTFEVVCQGTTNPWGHDWDEYGNLLFINTVIGHLWQGIPGAYFERMFGEHLAPDRYGLIGQAADHYHWDTGKSWTESRNAEAGADALGGGHAHSGLMIYQGDNWPEQYRGELFTLNFHGRRINHDHLEQSGSGLVGRHRPDFVKFGDPWFRGDDLDYGPDGAVYILDWSDTGECHGHDGVNRESGRIYRLVYNGSEALAPKDHPDPATLFTNSLSAFSSTDLLHLQFNRNEWFARHARRILQERAESGALDNPVRSELLKAYAEQTNTAIKLRLFFALHGIGADSQDWLTQQLGDPEFHVRCWAVRFLAESGGPWESLVPLLTREAVEDSSPAVRLELASALQRVPAELGEPLAAALVHHGEDATDHNLPLMCWYGIEPIAAAFPTNAVHLLAESRMPIVREYIARRIGEQLASNSNSVEALLQAATHLGRPAQTDLLRGLATSLKGWRNPPKPRAWDAVRDSIATSTDTELSALAREVGLIFGDTVALNQLKEIALNSLAKPQDRRSALEQLIETHAPAVQGSLEHLLGDPVTAGTAARGLLRDPNPEMVPKVIGHWTALSETDRPAVVGALVARISSATQLLDAMAKGAVPRGDLTAFHARAIQNLKDESLNRRLAEVWGKVRNSDADKKALMSHYRSILTPDRLKASDSSRGREVFTRTCAVCHKLHGQGAAIGPDLTGGGRSNLDYLLENIVDPNAIVPEDYRVSEVELKDDRSLTGLVVGRNERTITIQTPTEKLTLERTEISKLRQTNLSLMPDGLLQGMKEDEVANLIAYLMTPNQVPLTSQQSK